MSEPLWQADTKIGGEPISITYNDDDGWAATSGQDGQVVLQRFLDELDERMKMAPDNILVVGGMSDLFAASLRAVTSVYGIQMTTDEDDPATVI